MAIRSMSSPFRLVPTRAPDSTDGASGLDRDRVDRDRPPFDIAHSL